VLLKPRAVSHAEKASVGICKQNLAKAIFFPRNAVGGKNKKHRPEVCAFAVDKTLQTEGKPEKPSGKKRKTSETHFQSDYFSLTV
jgi:hypothetical protein